MHVKALNLDLFRAECSCLYNVEPAEMVAMRFPATARQAVPRTMIGGILIFGVYVSGVPGQDPSSS